MKLEKILIVDDRDENLEATRIVMPQADFARSAAEAIELLGKEEYDLVLTDMQMETLTAGLNVVKEALVKNAVPYVLTHTGPAHHGASTVEMKPYCGGIYFTNGKANAETWREALRRVENAEGAHLMYHQVIRRIKERGHPVVLDDAVITAIYFVRPYHAGGK